MPFNDCQTTCGSECAAWIFDRVRVRPRITGGTRIEWDLHPQFGDIKPHTFQLQVGRTGLADATDWEDVGFAADDAFYLVDDSQRVYGKTQWTHYRIKLTTPQGAYLSHPIPCLGDLGHRDWRILKEVIRRELLRFRQMAGQEGYLLKRRVHGTECSDCRDYVTREVVNAQCEECHGTGYLPGYYGPAECVWAALEREVRREHLDKGETRGTINDIMVPARMLAEPQLGEGDVWVDRKTDLRWFVHGIKHLVEMRGVPIVVQAKLRLAPFSDQIYDIEIPDQIPT